MPSLLEVIEARRAEIASKPPSPLREGETPDEAAERDAQRVSKAVSEMAARGVVEAFTAEVEGRSPNYDRLDDVVPQPQNTDRSPRADGPVLLERNGVKITKCVLDSRGIVEVICDSEDFAFDNPVYLVNPPLLVEDPNGDIEQVVGEDENGDPIIKKFRENPTQAMIDILADLKDESAPQNSSKNEGDA